MKDKSYFTTDVAGLLRFVGTIGKMSYASALTKALITWVDKIKHSSAKHFPARIKLCLALELTIRIDTRRG